VLVVFLRVVLCRFFRVLSGWQMVSVRKMSVMPCLFVRTSLVVFRCLLMMTGSVVVMFGRLLVMLRTLVFGHFRRSSFRDYERRYNRTFQVNDFENVRSPLIECV